MFFFFFPAASEDQDIVTDIRRLVQKVNEMKEQRKALHDQFRENIQKDDITSVLVTQEKADKEVGWSCLLFCSFCFQVEVMAYLSVAVIQEALSICLREELGCSL